MTVPWSHIARFLRWVVPLVPVVLENVATLRQSQPPASAAKTVEAQLAQLDRAISEQATAVEKLVERIEQLMLVLHGLQRTLILVFMLATAALVIAIVAVILAMTDGK